VYGISQRERDRRQAIAKNVFDALCEKYRDIVELMRNVMPNWGVLVGALFLTCCTVTTAPNLYRVTELIPGISTKDDAIAKLGTPTGTLNAASDAAAAQSRIGSASESDAGSVRSTPLKKNPPRAVSAPSSNT
jgi:hypothetical protein